MVELRGRPLGSEVRQNVIDVLFHMKKAYGYQIHKAYMDLFSPVTLRSIYYHLNKGLQLGLFKVEKIKIENGHYSWGTVAEKTFYSLTKEAKPRPRPEIKEYFEKKS